MSAMNNKKEIFDKEYMPYIIKWGKFTTWFSLLLIYLPAAALMIFYGARPPFAAVMSGIISICSANLAWYIVDPISLFPILGVPGLYMTYIAGNSKEIRAPAALQALDAAGVQGGTDEGTVISCLAIATSIFISVGVMTIVAIAGNVILGILPEAIITALGFLLPALFGALAAQRIVANPKVAIWGIPIAIVAKAINVMGGFKFLPFGGSYAQILICVVSCMFISKAVFLKANPQYKTSKK